MLYQLYDSQMNILCMEQSAHQSTITQPCTTHILYSEIRKAVGPGLRTWSYRTKHQQINKTHAFCSLYLVSIYSLYMEQFHLAIVPLYLQKNVCHDVLFTK